MGQRKRGGSAKQLTRGEESRSASEPADAIEETGALAGPLIRGHDDEFGAVAGAEGEAADEGQSQAAQDGEQEDA